MNYLDIIFLVPIAWFLYKGFTKGFVIEIATLIGLVVGVWGAIHFSELTAKFLQEDLSFTSEYLHIISFTITFIIAVVLVIILGKIIERFIDLVMLGFVNKLGGALFGVFKAAFLMSIVLFIINKYDTQNWLIKEESKSLSKLYKPIEQIAPAILPLIEVDKIKELFEKEIPYLEDDKSEKEEEKENDNRLIEI